MTNALTEISQAQRAIELAKTPQEANEIRARLKAIKKYLDGRDADFDTASKAAELMCQAAAKAGKLWHAETEKAKRGGDKRSINREISRLISVADAGFSDSKDATICVRLSEIDPQDWGLKKAELDELRRCLNEHVLHSLWKMMNFVEDEDRPWLRVYSIWNFQKPDDRFGQTHPGMIPGQVVQNLNWHYTKPGELVVDLFAGGGSTIDVCEYNDDDFGNRKCLGFDREPARKDIKKHDATNGLPGLPGEPSMIFLDPPYGPQKSTAYSDAGMDLANMSPAEYRRHLTKIVVECRQAARTVALIVGASQLGQTYVDHAAELIKDVGPANMRVIVPYSTQQYQAYDVTRAKRERSILNLHRDLLIWTK